MLNVTTQSFKALKGKRTNPKCKTVYNLGPDVEVIDVLRKLMTFNM